VDIIQKNTVAIGSTALNVQSLGGKTGISLDKDYTDTDAATVTGLEIDLDKTGASTTANTIVGINADLDNSTATDGVNTMIGANITPTLAHAADAGTPTVKGAVITATGNTNGTSVATGMELTSTGADTNNGLIIDCDDGGTDLKILSSADNNDFLSVAVAAAGATTITTVDDAAAAANLTLTIDGDIAATAAGGDISLTTATATATGAGFGAAATTMTVGNVNGEIVTTIQLSMNGLGSTAGVNEIIGAFAGGANGYITQITTAVNGLIYKVEMSCVEVPGGGGGNEPVDIDLWTNQTSLPKGDNALTDGSTPLQLIDAGANWTLGTRRETTVATSLANTVNGFLYITNGIGTADADGYGSGKFVIKLYGASF